MLSTNMKPLSMTKVGDQQVILWNHIEFSELLHPSGSNIMAEISVLIQKIALDLFFFYIILHLFQFVLPRFVSWCDTADLGADGKLTCCLSDGAAAVKSLLWARRLQCHSPLHFVAKAWAMRKNLLGLFVYVPWPDNHHRFSRIVWKETRNHMYSAVSSFNKAFLCGALQQIIRLTWMIFKVNGRKIILWAWAGSNPGSHCCIWLY